MKHAGFAFVLCIVMETWAAGPRCLAVFERSAAQIQQSGRGPAQSPQASMQQLQTLLQFLLDLPPIALDFPSPLTAIRQLISEVQGLDQVLSRLKILEHDIVKNPEHALEIARAARGLFMEIASLAEQRVRHYDPKSREQRRELEAYRILLGRTAQLLRSASEEVKKQLAEEMDDKPDSNEDNPEGEQQSAQQKNQKPQNSKQQKSKKFQQLKKQMEKQLQDQNRTDPEDIKNLSDAEMDELVQEAESELRQNPNPQESNLSEDAKQALAERMSEYFKSQQKSNPSKKRKGQKGEGQQGEGQEGQSQGESQADGNTPGQGGAEGDAAHVTQALSDLIKKLLENVKTKNQAGKKLSAKNAKGQEEKQNSWFEQQRNPEEKPPRSKQDQKTQAESIDLNSLIKIYLDDLWLRTLRNFEDSRKLSNALAAFSTTCDRLSRHFQEHKPLLTQYQGQATKLRQTLDSYPVDHTSLGQFAGQMLLHQSGETLQRRLHYLDKVLAEISATGKISEEESRVLDSLRRFLGAGKTAEPSDDALIEAFTDQLLGPLSRKTILDEFHGRDGQLLDKRTLADAIRSGQLNDLIAMPQLRPYLDLLFKATHIPSKRIVFTGSPGPINEAEMDLDLATELDQIEHFYFEGFGLREEILRFLSGDMLEKIYRTEQTRIEPTQPVRKEITIYLYDISGSMTSGDKFLLRNLLMAAHMDHSMRKAIQNGELREFYSMAFAEKASAPVRVNGLVDTFAHFNQLRKQGLGGGGGTRISSAIISALELIEKHLAEGGSLAHANIVLITDSEENAGLFDFEGILKAREKIGARTRVLLNAITLGEFNQDVEQVVKGRERAGFPSEEARHYHISNEDLKHILDLDTQLEQLKNVAKEGQSRNAPWTANDLSLLKRAILALENRRARDDTQVEVMARDIGRALSSAGGAALDEDRPAWDLFRVGMEGLGASRKSLRLELLEGFLSQVTKSSGRSVASVLSAAGPDVRSSLRKWLGI